MAGRITYNGINIDFEREFNDFSIKTEQRNALSQAASGKESFLNFYNQDFITASRRLLTGHEQNQLDKFYEYARDGSTFSFERDRNLGTYIPFEGKSLDTNDGTAGTLTRTLSTDSAYYVDPLDGLLKVVNSADTGRFVEGKYGSGLMLQGAQTNLITHPSQFNNASWTQSIDISVTADTTETKDPMGTNLADILVSGGPVPQITFTTSAAVGTDDAAFGVLMKTNSGTHSVVLRITGTTGGSTEVTHVVDAVGTNADWTTTGGWGWYTIDTANSGFSGNWEFEIELDGANDVYAFGATGVAGAGMRFVGMPIGCLSTTSITRNIENLTYPTTNIVNQTKGTVAFWFKPEFQKPDNPTVNLFWIDSDNVQVRILSAYILNSGTMEVRYYNQDGSFAQIATFNSLWTINQNQWHHFAFTYNNENAIIFYLDGVLKDQQLSGFPLNVANVTGNLYIGRAGAFGVFDDFLIAKEVLTAGEINNIYNRGRGEGYRKNRYSSVRLANPNNNPIYKNGNRYGLNLEMKEVL